MKIHKQKRKQKRIGSNNFIIEHIKNNIREYAILFLLFIIGVLIGIFCLNSISEDAKKEVIEYIENYVACIKSSQEINYLSILKSAIIKNSFFAVVLWILGIAATMTPIIYLTISFKGFCFGYAISAIVATYSRGNGLIISASVLLMQNIIAIPIIIGMAVSGLHVNRKIMKDTKDKSFHTKHGSTKDIIKYEIVRHSIFSLIMTGILLISSLIETYISMNLCRFAVQII